MTILLLAGTGEARAIARGLAEKSIPAIASLAGVTRDAADLGLPTFKGGFGGEEGFRTFLADHDITAIIDATHPFAARISHRTARVAAVENVRYVQVLRPEWQQGPQDRWIFASSEEDAAGKIPKDAVVFLATGRQTLAQFSALKGQKVYCRQIDPPDSDFPFPGGEFIIGRPPFAVAAEEDLFRRLAIDYLVVKNAGGAASSTKLDAARNLGITVVMIKRPPQPDALRVTTAEAALEWAETL